MAASPLYVYAIAGDPIPLAGLQGVTGETLIVIPASSASSATAGTCHAIAGEIAEAPSMHADTLRAQDALVRQLAARADALLPARFGSRFDDEAAVRRVLAELWPYLKVSLARVRGCEQMTLRIFANDVTLRAQPRVADGATASPPPADAGPGTQYLQRRAAEVRQVMAELDPLRARLAAHVRDERVERGRSPVIGSIHHLIPRGTADEYRAVLDEGAVVAEMAARGIRLRVSGPSPAYAFAEVTLS